MNSKNTEFCRNQSEFTYTRYLGSCLIYEITPFDISFLVNLLEDSFWKSDIGGFFEKEISIIIMIKQSDNYDLYQKFLSGLIKLIID